MRSKNISNMSNPLVNVITLAKLFNLTDRRVQQLAKDGIILKAEKGKYDLISCTRSYIKYLQERAAGRDVEPQDAYFERARLTKAQADKTELEVLKMKGELIPTEQAELLWSGLIIVFRASMLSMPSRLAHKILACKTYPEVVEVMTAGIFEALEKLSRYDPEQSDIDIEEGSEVSSTTSETEGQPMGESVQEP